MIETGRTNSNKNREALTKTAGSVLQAYLPQSSRSFLLVNVNEVAYHPPLNGAALCLHPYLEIILNINVRRKQHISPRM